MYNSFPNPFSDFTTIHFTRPEAGWVEISVFDMQGNLVATPLNEYRQQGRHQVIWNACNSKGERVSPGIYFYRIQSGGKQTTGKLTVF